jgi:hypothetical protein
MNIFDKKGQLDLTGLDEEIAALTPDRHRALDLLISASGAASAAEAALKNEEAAVKTAMAAQAEAAREVERVSRKPTHHDLFLAHVKKIAPPPPSDAQIAAEAAVDVTAEALAISRDAFDAARQSVKDSRASFATALGIWQNDGQPIPTQNELVRQMAKKFKKAAPVSQPVFLSEIDRVAAASSGAIDTRQHGQHFRRGAEGKRSFPPAFRGQRLPGFVKG